jgi:hypothetical protein
MSINILSLLPSALPKTFAALESDLGAVLGATTPEGFAAKIAIGAIGTTILSKELSKLKIPGIGTVVKAHKKKSSKKSHSKKHKKAK